MLSFVSCICHCFGNISRVATTYLYVRQTQYLSVWVWLSLSLSPCLSASPSPFLPISISLSPYLYLSTSLSLHHPPASLASGAEDQLTKGFVMCPVAQPCRTVSKFKAQLQAAQPARSRFS